MSRINICIMLIILLIGCVGRPIPQKSGISAQILAESAAQAQNATIENTEKSSSREQHLSSVSESSLGKVAPLDKNEVTRQELPLIPLEVPSQVKAMPLKKTEFSTSEQQLFLIKEQSPKKTTPPPKKNDLSKSYPKPNHPKTQIQEGHKEYLEDAERDIMDEALVLLNESHNYWVNGDLENALEMLDQAYALLLDTNGNPDIARQKDDLRLMISKRILSIYNSLQTVAKGKRSEIPVIVNTDVEKEIRQFQTVEREFFISSYQRSAMYRPIILRELKKAGLPEELAWLPLVESGFKINALSSARALGLWQFIPSTGYKYGLNRDDWVDERMDIEKSTRAAIDYLKELHTMFGDWLTVLAAYNCGEGRVMRTIASQHINYLDRFWDLYRKLPYETARYVPRFLATILVIKDPQKYGIDLGVPKMEALSYEIVEVKKSMRLQDIAQKLETPEETLNILNAELRHRITPDRPYILRVPTTMAERLIDVIDEIPQAEKLRESHLSKRAVIRHKVRGGESLASIAIKYNISVATLVDYNHLSKKHRPVAGQRLNVPIQMAKVAGSTTKSKAKTADNTFHHKVQKGDTLASLARKYDTTVTELRKSNLLENDTLKIDQMLRIDAGNDEVDQRSKRSSGKKGEVKEKVAVKSASGKETESKKIRKYMVKKGDSLNKIARENNMSLDKLLALNSLARKNSIHPGQVILIQ
jgi:membrane-bound lytic murein transglycosylase D